MLNHKPLEEEENRPKNLRVLVIEDSPLDAELIIRELERCGHQVTWQRVEQAEDLAKMLDQRTWDIVLSDYAMPRFDGISALKIVRSKNGDLPFILISGTIGEDLAVEAMHAGADDYLIKDRLARLGSAVDRALQMAEQRRSISKAEHALRISELKYRKLFNENPLPAVIFDRETLAIVDVNKTAIDHYGYTRDEFLSMTTKDIRPPEEIPEHFKGIGLKAADVAKVPYYRHQKKDGTVIDVVVSAHDLELNDRSCRLVLFTDITERRLSENALRESEELLRITLNAIPEGILVVDGSERISHMNRQFARMWHIPLDKDSSDDTLLLITNMLDQIDDPDGFKARIDEINCSDHEVMDEIRLKDGRVFERYSSPIFIGGENRGSIQDFRDITERKRNEEAVQESEKRYREIFNATSEAIIIQDAATGKVLDINETMLRMYGFENREQVLQHDIGNISVSSHGFTEEEARQRVCQAARGQSQVFEWLAKKITGEQFWVEVSLHKSLIRGEDVVLAAVRDISERKRAEQDMRLVQYGVNRARDGVFWLDSETRLVYVNETACDSLGYLREELLSMKVSDIDPDFPPEAWELHLAALRERGSITFESRHRAKDGRIFPVEITSNYVNFEGEEGSFAFARDISERKQAEEERKILQDQLIQAQKLESIGRLAGGVAHDFNNALTVIIGYAMMILKKPEIQGTLRMNLEEILNAGRRSADLTRQLLAFARKQTIAPKILDLNEIVEGVLKMLRRLIGEDIDLVWIPESRLWRVRMDPVQIDQILANLCVNARDAIEGVGKITIETHNVTLNESYPAAQGDVLPGEYVMLTVSDNGSGMDDDTKTRIFEPFFTTKGVGQGTGLGLATVYGIVKQNNGYINVHSELGCGTTLKIYIPHHAEELSAASKPKLPESPQGHGEVILLVEDEASTLKLVRIMLEDIGYKVLTASTPTEAICIAQEREARIDLLITDVIMPEMDGKELAERLQTIRPGLLCLFMSGYTADGISQLGILHEGVKFIQKPISIDALAVKIYETLGV